MSGPPPFSPADETPPFCSGLELLATAVVLLDGDLDIRYVNPAAENLFELSKRQLIGHPARSVFGDAPALFQAIEKALANGASYTEQELEIGIAARRACTFRARFRSSMFPARFCCSNSATSISS